MCYIFAPIPGYFFERGIQIANYLIINAMSSQPEYLISTLHNLKSLSYIKRMAGLLAACGSPHNIKTHR